MLYNVYRWGILNKENLTDDEVVSLTGIKKNSVNSYMRRNTVTRSGYCVVRSVAKVMPVEKSYVIDDTKFTKDWNNMMAAADLIRKGLGRLVCHGGRKYVEVIDNG